VVADESAPFNCERIVVGWKDTREARRALVDALPFLERAKAVNVITISEGEADAEREKLDQILAWLDAHGVSASSELIESDGGFVDVLESTARASHADLVVAGGYGHSRMRELLFGGMTRNLIAASSINRLFSN
jgi:nucleotide-binding universal stress UspA family protein